MLFLTRANDNKPVFRYSNYASIKLDSCAVGGACGVRRFSHKLHHNMPGRPENGSACFISAALIRTTSPAFRSLLSRASSIRATCQNVSCQGGFSCYNEPDIRSKLNRMNQELPNVTSNPLLPTENMQHTPKRLPMSRLALRLRTGRLRRFPLWFLRA